VPFLKNKKIDSARLDVELLIAHALGFKNRIDVYLQLDRPLNEVEVSKIREFIRRRGLQEPIAYILGYRYFYKSKFSVNSHVLIPRPETEHIVEHSLNFLSEKKSPERIRIADLGCGTGCIGLSIACELETLNKAYILNLFDFSAQALEVSELNARSLLIPEEKSHFHLKDLNFYKPEETYDLIVGNPPYIANNDPGVELSAHNFEPHSALYAEDEGLFCTKSWLNSWCSSIAPQGLLMFEIGHLQKSALEKFFVELRQSRSELSHLDFEFVKDLNKKDRFFKIFSR
jgi:release factor glutamine methyltransferase